MTAAARFFQITKLVLLLIGGSVGGFYGIDFLLNAYRFGRVPRNFSVVKANVLYRSGQMRPEHFRQMLMQHGIKTVFATNMQENEFEANICRQLGVRFVQYDMPGSGIGEAELFHEYLDILGDPSARPVLIHCAAGAYRTGVGVALYRLLYEGWSLDDAVEEMRYSGCGCDHEVVGHVQKVYESIPQRVLRKVVISEEGYRELR